MTKVSRTTPQKSLGTFANETESTGLDREISEERYISRKKTVNYSRSKFNIIIYLRPKKKTKTTAHY